MIITNHYFIHIADSGSIDKEGIIIGITEINVGFTKINVGITEINVMS
jgi:hypothetical protein